MFKCLACQTYGTSPTGFTHGPTCSALDGSEVFAWPESGGGYAERRTRAMERQAEAAELAAKAIAAGSQAIGGETLLVMHPDVWIELQTQIAHQATGS